MKALNWLTWLVVALLVAFAAANWHLLIAPATLNLLLFDIQWPLGAMLLGLTLVLVVFNLAYGLSLRTASLVSMRRHAKELEALRELSDRAEASRFTALGIHLDEQVIALRADIGAVRTEVVGRIDALEKSFLVALHETSNSLAAYAGEIDHKLDHVYALSGKAMPQP